MKLGKYIIGITLLLFVIVFFATMPGRKRYEEGVTTQTTPPAVTSASGVTTPPSATAPPIVSESTAKPVGGEPDAPPSASIDNEWALYLINQDNPLPDDFTVTAEKVFGKFEMDSRAAPFMKEMIAAAKADGANLGVISALRTIEYQKTLLDTDVKAYQEQGMSYDDAYKKAAEAVAIPGQSEHNAGLCADILEVGNYTLTEGFDQTPEFKWLSEHAAEYGFILRYPKSKESITGIIYEPWHYRFVGKYYAAAISESGLCLEEFIKNN